MKVRCSFVLGGLIYETMLERLTREQRTFIPIYDWWAVPTLPQRLVGRAQPTLVGRAHPTAALGGPCPAYFGGPCPPYCAGSGVGVCMPPR
jgi:hypothetical protein